MWINPALLVKETRPFAGNSEGFFYFRGAKPSKLRSCAPLAIGFFSAKLCTFLNRSGRHPAGKLREQLILKKMSFIGASASAVTFFGIMASASAQSPAYNPFPMLGDMMVLMQPISNQSAVQHLSLIHI